MHLEVLNSKRRKIFQGLKKFPEFYLSGGTALALQIGHRISVDFDLFSRKDISPNLLNKVEKIFKGSKIDVIVSHFEQLSVNIDKIRVDFVKYPFSLILQPIKFQGVNILKFLEIAVMKAYVLGRRASFKDYVDLYYLSKEGYVSLEKIIKFAEKKYGDGFDGRLFLEQLIYLKDVKDEKIQFLKRKTEREEIQKFFEKEIKKLRL